MANLATSGVTINYAWREGAVNGNRNNVYNVTVVLSGQGGGTNLIPASAFSLQKFEKTSNWIKSDSSAIVVAAVTPDGSGIILGTTPGDVTGTYAATVTGLRNTA